MRFSFRLLPTFGLLLLAGATGGCGNPGSPEPPSLWLPVPVKDLAAQRTGNTVSLTWTMSSRTTDQLLLKKDQVVSVCRAVGKSPCASAGQLEAEPGKVAHFSDALPAALTTGPVQLIRYSVRLKNHAGQDAGPSNSAYSATGTAPPDVQAVTAQATAKGILVRWDVSTHNGDTPLSGAKLIALLTRDRILSKGESATPSRAETDAGVPQPLQQALATTQTIVRGQWVPSQTLDTNALLNRTYRYTVQLEQQEQVDGRSITLQGASAASTPLHAKDVFPPDVPQGLYAAANPQGAAIDLSWTPDSSADTAGYFVYRRQEGDAAPAVRVSGHLLLTAPAWSDASAKPGVRYAYSVSAIDTSGNESARSEEVTATLPAPGDASK